MAEGFIDLKLEGVKEIIDAFAILDDSLKRRISRRALTAGAKIFARAARKNAPRRRNKKGNKKQLVGRLRRNIIWGFSKKRSTQNQPVVLARIRGGTKFARDDPKNAYYGGWVEFGHHIVPRFRGKYTDYKLRGLGRLTGLNKRRRAARLLKRTTQPAKFMQKAFDSQAGTALAAIIRATEAEMQKEIQRAANATKKA